MSEFPQTWGDECWVIAPALPPETCTVQVDDLDGLLELPIQDELTVPMGGVAQMRDMITQLPPVPVERQGALDELMTPAAGVPWETLATVWLIGSGVLTATALIAALVYLTVHHRRTPSVEVSS